MLEIGQDQLIGQEREISHMVCALFTDDVNDSILWLWLCSEEEVSPAFPDLHVVARILQCALVQEVVLISVVTKTEDESCVKTEPVILDFYGALGETP